MTKYKITTTENKTYGNYQWTPGKWKETSGIGGLCTDGWLHCYHHPILAILLNSLHGDFPEPFKLWEVEVGGKFNDDRGLKCGYSRMRLVKEIEVPAISVEQRVAFGILCAKRVCADEKWLEWADGWLKGKDRSYSAARTATYTARTGAAAAADAADADDPSFLVECVERAMELGLEQEQNSES